MKILYILCLSILLQGCGWFGNNDTNMPNDTATNNQDTIKTSEMKDLFTYFDEQKITYSNAKDIDVVDINAYEGKMFEYEGKPVYVYRMNRNDKNIQSWMDEIKNTGKVTINQNGKEATYDALINGEYMMVSEAGQDLNQLSESFNKYEIK